jgi:hypothetical protein
MTDREIADWAVSRVEETVPIKDKDARQIAYYAALLAANKAVNEEIKTQIRKDFGL